MAWEFFSLFVKLEMKLLYLLQHYCLTLPVRIVHRPPPPSLLGDEKGPGFYGVVVDFNSALQVFVLFYHYSLWWRFWEGPFIYPLLLDELIFLMYMNTGQMMYIIIHVYVRNLYIPYRVFINMIILAKCIINVILWLYMPF